jgi:crotonobetainyl-CoA:carnitine CoA-transferase CaiB-like acyl-CoA transferase
MSGPLAGIRVIDISERSPAAAIACMTLCDYGAEVIKVERVGGDSLRALDACQVWLRGQKSVTLSDGALTDGSWNKLRDSADVVIDTIHTPVPRLSPLLSGSKYSPRQILAFITSLPCAVDDILQEKPSSPRSSRMDTTCGYGELVEAQYGCLHLQDGFRDGPVFLGWPHAVYGAAWLIQLGLLGALFEREKKGYGQRVTTSLMEGMAAVTIERFCTAEKLAKKPTGRSSIRRQGNKRSVVSYFECSDKRWIYVHTGPRGAFDRLMHVVGRDDLAVGGRQKQFSTPELSQEVADDMWDHLRRTFATKPADYWVETLNGCDVSCMPILETGEVLSLEQMAANGVVDYAPGGRRQFGLSAKFGRTPGEVRHDLPAPGQHTAEVLNESAAEDGGPAASRVELPANGGSSGEGPLEGVLVLDPSSYIAAPYATRLLSDLGARVVKVEEPDGQTMRHSGSAHFLVCERGKESCPLDLKAVDGIEKFRRLASRADVIIHNMRLDAVHRLGIEYEALSQLNPGLVYCHASGYGNDGPWGKLPAFGVLQTAVSGLMYRAAGRNNPPTNILASLDNPAGLMIAVAVLAALVEKARSGRGQFVEVVQAATGVLGNSDVYYEDGKKSDSFELDHQQLGFAPTNALYRTKDNGILIACYCDEEWQAVPKALGITANSSVSYAVARRQKIEDSPIACEIVQRLSELTAADAHQRLSSAGVPSAIPIPLPESEVIADETLRRLGVVVDEEQAQYGKMQEIGRMMRFERHHKVRAMPAPALGQHRDKVLGELAAPIGH